MLVGATSDYPDFIEQVQRLINKRFEKIVI